VPNYLYYCHPCEVEFEELLIQSDEIKQYRDGGFPCPVCHKPSERIKVNTISFNFKGGTPGNSGSHDIDYPTLDKAVGRSADKKWQGINQRKEARDKVRRESGTNAISQTPDGKNIPADPAVLQTREQALKSCKKDVYKVMTKQELNQTRPADLKSFKKDMNIK
jgi:hypothetical protein